MALVVKDRVRVNSVTAGTGTITLGAAITGYQDFSVIGDGNTTYYTIADSITGDWEVGIGTYTASGTTLSRDTILESSNAGSAVNFAANPKDVFVTYPAEKAVLLDANNGLFPANDLPAFISVNSSSDAFRITQTGTGNALLVEDDTNPDGTPFVINADGQITQGSQTRSTIGSITPNFLVQNNTSSTANGIGVATWLNSAAGSKFAFGKSRSTTIGTAGIVSSGDAIATISFAGDDGVSFRDAASITASVDGTPGVGDMPGRLAFSTTADGAATPTERMRIDNAGVISLGAAPGSESLRVTRVASAVNYLQAAGGTTGDGAAFSAQGSDTNINIFYGSKGTGGHFFRTDGSGGPNQFVVSDTASAVNYLQATGGATGNAATLLAAGDDTNINIALTPKGTGGVGIGTTAPATDLDVVGPAGVTSFTGTTKLGVVVRGSTAATDYSGIDFIGNSQTNPTARIGVLTTGSGAYLQFGTSDAYASGITNTAMTIADIGNVGINTSSPNVDYKLHVAGNVLVTNNLRVEGEGIRTSGGGSAATPSIQPGEDANTGMYWIGSDTIGFSTGGTERARISSTGRFSIGTTGTSGRLTAVGSNSIGVYGETQAGTSGGLYGVYGISNVSSAYASGGVIGFSINANTYGILGYWSGSAYWSFYGNNNTYITGTYQGSDERLKENILTLSGSLSKIGALRPVEFDWKENSDQAKSGHHRDVGLIAQEVLPIFPNLVKEIDARQPDEGVKKSLNEELGKFYTIEYTRLIPHLISAIQEQQVLIAKLQADVAALQGN